MVLEWRLVVVTLSAAGKAIENEMKCSLRSRQASACSRRNSTKILLNHTSSSSRLLPKHPSPSKLKQKEVERGEGGRKREASKSAFKISLSVTF